MTEWRVHLGVHKTATTHLQGVLDAARDILAAKGVGYIPVSALRPVTGDIFRPPGIRRRFLGPKPAMLGDALATLTGGHDTVVVSEENWIGEAWEACIAPPYPEMTRRMEKLKDLPGDAQLRLFLSIRNPADFATSVVAEALRHHPGKVSIERARASWLGKSSIWTDLVRQVKGAFPEAPLTIWAYEDYRLHAKTVAETLAGVAIEEFPDLADPVATKRPSAVQVAEMSGNRWKSPHFPTSLNSESKAHEDDKPFVLFSEDEKQAMSAHYEQDKAAIRAAFPGAFLALGT